MMVKKGIFRVAVALWFFSGSYMAYGQKEISKQFEATNIGGVVVDSDQIFRIHVKTDSVQTITAGITAEGETFETVMLQTEIKNNQLYLGILRTPGFKKMDDKLAAHKAISIVLDIVMPAEKALWIDASIASVDVEGYFDNINFNLASGDCTLRNFRGRGIINTGKGNILVETNDMVIDAHTRNGILKMETLSPSYNQLELRSVDGNITVKRSK